jgi:hypothetical protein
MYSPTYLRDKKVTVDSAESTDMTVMHNNPGAADRREIQQLTTPAKKNPSEEGFVEANP